MKIEIHNNDTVNTGEYKIWFTQDNGIQNCCNASENFVSDILTKEQNEQFFMGKFIFELNDYGERMMKTNRIHPVAKADYETLTADEIRMKIIYAKSFSPLKVEYWNERLQNLLNANK